MPEGDTVFKLAAYLRPALAGRELADGSLVTASGERLGGLRVGEVTARGKHLFIELGERLLLRSHLGMWGSWHAYAIGEAWQKPSGQASLVLRTPDRVYVCFNAREVELMRNAGVRQQALERHLGPDLLAARPAFDDILQRARAIATPDVPVADLLLDQRVATGIGNVYKSESLFLCGIDPRSSLAAVSDRQLHGLFAKAAELLRGNTRGGPRVTRRANDEAGILWVYGRTRQPCLRCDTAIRAARIGRHQRSTYWCPVCQCCDDR